MYRSECQENMDKKLLASPTERNKDTNPASTTSFYIQKKLIGYLL